MESYFSRLTRIPRWVLLFGLLTAVLTGFACRPQLSPTQVEEETAATPTRAEAQPVQPIQVGIEYASPGLAHIFAPTGLRRVKPWPALASWGDVEPESGQFRWNKVDQIIREYQKAGFEYFQLMLTSDGHPATPADPNFLAGYTEYARQVVERYDGDGQDDMPGLRYPIHQFGLEREFTGYWPFSSEDYIRLLQRVYPVIKEADPQGQVLLIAILVTDVFDGNPPPDEAMRRLHDNPKGMRKSGAEILSLLDQPAYFDILDFHSLGDYSEIPPTVSWLRAEMQQRGYDKPIWIGDAFSMSPLIGYGLETCEKGPLSGRAFYPATEATRCQAAQVIQTVRQEENPQHEVALTWLRAEAAKGLVKKIVVAAGEGVAGINIGNMEDWPLVGAGTAHFQGMVDALAFSGTPQPRPAYHSLSLLVAKLDGLTQAERLTDLGDGVWAYRFTVGERPVYVLWHEPEEIAWPGEAEASAAITLPWDGTQAIVTPIVTHSDQSAPQAQTISAENGQLHLDLTSVPVIVEMP